MYSSSLINQLSIDQDVVVTYIFIAILRVRIDDEMNPLWEKYGVKVVVCREDYMECLGQD